MPDQTYADRKHRRDTRLNIWLPFAGGLLLLIGAVVVAALLPLRSQLSVVSDFLVTVLVLCPLAVCLFPVYIGLVALVFLMNGVHDKTGRALGKTVNWSHSLNRWVDAQSERLEKRMIGISARWASVERVLLKAFDEDRDDKHNR